MSGECTILPGKGLSLLHLNARSIRNKFPQIKTEMWNKGIDILCFTETWLTSINLNVDFDLPGYNLYRVDRAREMRAGGVCVYVREDFSCDSCKFSELNMSNDQIEIQWLVVSKGKSKKMLIGNVYRPPTSSDKNVFITELNNLIGQINDLDKYDVVITGDMNINVLVDSNERDNLYGTLGDYTLRQLISDPTRVAESQTCIDLLFTNVVHVNSYGVANINVSDHFPIYMRLKRDKIVYNQRQFKGRSYKNYDSVKFGEAFSRHDWSLFDESNDIEECWNIYLHAMSNVLDIDCPIKTFIIKNKDEPWLTPELKTRIAEKNLALKKARRTNTVLNWHIANTLKNQISTDCKEAHRSYVVEETERNKNDAKEFWSSMRKLIPGKNVKSKQINLKNEDGTHIETSETADYINNYFSDIGPKLAEKHDKEWNFEGQVSDTPMPDIVVSEEIVVAVIKDININKSSAIDYVSTKVFRDSVLRIPSKFTKIVGLSLNNSIIPRSWKQAKVTPLPKSGDLSNVSNFRPISQLPIPGKVLERIVHTNISSHLELCNILVKEQGGYRKKCSTIDTIGVLTNDILRARNKGCVTLAAFIDIKKAFDSVNYIILLKKLEKYGIRGRNLLWIKNYFTGRSQVTVCNDKTSNVIDMTCGTPQGSILGPLFFLLYVNDLKINFNNVNTLMYADDTVLYTSGKSLNVLAQNMQASLDNFVNWTSKNKLTINESKTKLMLFSSSIKSKSMPVRNLDIKINNEKLKFVPTYKYLGVLLDYELTFNHHVKELKKNLAFKSYLLALLKSYVPTAIMLIIYKTYVLPLFDYADIVYHGSGSTGILLLQSVQNRCLKYCHKVPILTSTNVIHKMSNLPKLSDRRVYHAQIYGFKQSKKVDLLNIRPRNTREAMAPLLKYSNIVLTSYEKSIEVFVAQTWNGLDKDLRNIVDLSSFKLKMKELLAAKINLYVD